jgi:RNA polymerase sigma-70 factor (ECF subfamily)
VREVDLDELMARLARGDRSAFDPLYAALRPRALRVVSARLGAEHASDVAQSALLAVFARASEFTPGRACLPWFYAIVANELQAARRKHARTTIEDVADDALVDDRDPEGELVTRELARAVDLAIAALDADSANAIGALLGRAPMPAIPAATFRKRVSRAYAKLRLLLGGHDVG